MLLAKPDRIPYTFLIMVISLQREVSDRSEVLLLCGSHRTLGDNHCRTLQSFHDTEPLQLSWSLASEKANITCKAEGMGGGVGLSYLVSE